MPPPKMNYRILALILTYYTCFGLPAADQILQYYKSSGSIRNFLSIKIVKNPRLHRKRGYRMDLSAGNPVAKSAYLQLHR